MTSGQGSPGRPQVQLGTLLAHPAAPSVGATVCMFLAMVLPLVGVTVSMGGMAFGAASLPGSTLLGTWGWLGILAFGGAVATRTVPAAMPYRSIVDAVALAAWAVLVLVLAYHAMNPIPGDTSAAVSGMDSLVGGSPGRPGGTDFAAELRRATQRAVAVTPAIGLLPFLAAGPLAWLGRRRAQQTAVSA